MTAKGRTRTRSHPRRDTLSQSNPTQLALVFIQAGKGKVYKYALGVGFYLKCAAATERCKLQVSFTRIHANSHFAIYGWPGGHVLVRVRLRGQLE